MARGIVVLLFVAVVLVADIFLAAAQHHTPSFPAAGSSLALPHCPNKCGNVTVPYPFGIGKKCSLPVPGFELQCNRTSTGELTLYLSTDLDSVSFSVVNVSLLPTQVSILMSPSSTCNLSKKSVDHLVPSPRQYLHDSFRFSGTNNVLTVLGCNTLGYMYVEDEAPLGCASLCGNGSSLADGQCTGVGCCQVAMPLSFSNYKTYLRYVDLPILPERLSRNAIMKANIPAVTGHSSTYRPYANTSNLYKYHDNRRLSAFLRPISHHCGSAFLIEKGKYIYHGADAEMDISNRSYPVVLEWSVGDTTNCTEAQANSTTYACKSNYSDCLNTTSFGYSCKCKPGFDGNPYIANGCQDIDECEDSKICKYGRTCVNYIGHYSCVCPNGTSAKSWDYYCMPIDYGEKYQKSNHTNFGIALGFGIAFGILSILGLCTIIYKKVQKKRVEDCRIRFFKNNYDMLLKQQLISCGGENIVEKIKFFPLLDLEKATNNFDKSCIVGKGGHGIVYKGLINLRVVAIKLSNVANQNEIQQFINEILLLSQVNHRNIVKLVGCCLESEVPLLVYEFVPNGTLYDHLYKCDEDFRLSWEDRLRIATEISSALVYLHSAANISIFHRDIKTLNILLDDKLVAKVSDFGISRYIASEETHVSTNIQGTLGYLDPEYLQTGQLTEKTDVYSLAVILVELMTGKKPTFNLKSQEEGNTISSFMLAMNENRLYDVVDPSIIENSNSDEIKILSEIALAGLSINGKDRPSMKHVLSILEGLTNANKSLKKIKSPSMQYENSNIKIDVIIS